jgi:O-antigen ligase
MTSLPLPARPTDLSRAALYSAALVTLAGLLAVLPLRLAGLLVMAPAVGLLLLRHPWLAWIGLGVSLPITAGIKLGPMSVADITLAGAIFLWFADGIRCRSLRLNWAALPGFVALYLAALLVTAVGAVDLADAGREVIKWAEVFAVVWLVSQQATRLQARWLALSLLSGAALQAGLGIYQFIFRIGPDAFVLMERFMRAAGSFGQPNPYAGYLGLSLPVAVSLALWGWQRFLALDASAQERGAALLWAGIYSGLAGVIGLGLLASWSRGGWIGAAAGVGFVIVFRSRRALLASVTAGVAGLIALGLGGLNPAWVPASIGERLADLPAYLGIGINEILRQPVTDANFSIIERLAHWMAAWRMWEMAPWLGIGPGNYPAIYPAVQVPGWDDPLGHAHNIYLNVLAESGLVGLAAYLLFWGATLLWLVDKLRKARRASWEQALLVGIVGVIIHLSIHNFFDNLFVQGIYLHLALWLALSQIVAHGENQGIEQIRDSSR